MSIGGSMQVIADFHRQLDPPVEFEPPVTDDELAAHRHEFGADLPPQLVQLLQISNGCRFFLGDELLSLNRIASQRREWSTVLIQMGADPHGHVVSRHPGRVAAEYWNRGWVPFTVDGGGNGLAIDTAPGPDGVVGQVINYGSDDDYRMVCAPSLEAFLARIAAEITAGNASWGDHFAFFGDPADDRAMIMASSWTDQDDPDRTDHPTTATDDEQPAPTPPIRLELHADGGIAVAPTPDSQRSVIPLPVAEGWVRYARANSKPVEVSGEIDHPDVVPTVDRLRAVAEPGLITVTATEPEPFAKRYTTMQWAAAIGRADLIADLLERGVAPPRRGLLTWLRPRSPIELAIRRGHVDAVRAFRAGGVTDPVRHRPPGAPDAVVFRIRVGYIAYGAAPVVLVLGLVGGLIARLPEAIYTGAIMAAALLVMGAVTDWAVGRNNVAVDGPLLWTRRNLGWRGPVDLRQVIAIGYAPSAHPRSPTLLRFGNQDHGFPARWLTSRRGFDDDQIADLIERDVNVLTVQMTPRFLMPGLERYVGTQIDRNVTSVSHDAATRLFPS